MAALYFHIPFCKRRCLYCDFYSTTRSELAGRYVQALCRELELRRSFIKEEERSIGSIYFGGGTPSQLPPQAFDAVFDAVSRLYRVQPGCEITLEANPDDLSPGYVADLARLPFNRISMGVQSFDDGLLGLIGRRHTARQAVEAVERCRRAGFGNVSIDLMFGLPGQSAQVWESDLERALALGVEHLSAYGLIYEEGTPLTRLLREGKIAAADDDFALACYNRLIDRLVQAGYEHYEISNFARPGFRSRHNSCYWQGTPYLGLGAAAHSYNGGERTAGVASLTRYIEAVEAGSPALEVERLDAVERYNDAVITRLRTSQGLSMPWVRRTFGRRLSRHCEQNARRLAEEGLLALHDGWLRLTRRGLFVSDAVFRELIFVE